MSCPPCSGQWTIETGAWRGTEGDAGQGSDSCCHCSTEKNTHMYHKNNVKIAWSRKRLLCGWVGAFIVFLSPPPYFFYKIVTVIPTVTILYTPKSN